MLPMGAKVIAIASTEDKRKTCDENGAEIQARGVEDQSTQGQGAQSATKKEGCKPMRNGISGATDKTNVRFLPIFAAPGISVHVTFLPSRI